MIYETKKGPQENHWTFTLIETISETESTISQDIFSARSEWEKQKQGWCDQANPLGEWPILGDPGIAGNAVTCNLSTHILNNK